MILENSISVLSKVFSGGNPADGRQWGRLLAAGGTFDIDELSVRVLHSPGHTLASITYVIGDAAFVHDTLFQPDFGTAWADFPGGDAQALWHSIQQILALPRQHPPVYRPRLYAGWPRAEMGKQRG
ncbi:MULTISPECIES: hypothetical protein [unclassified Halomonas]|uniref:hypothetical protein n=1 Tax=unclassified Halomonas TaxID=2609666 RepID=UPI0040339C78